MSTQIEFTKTPQQNTKETSWDNGEPFITMMLDKSKHCNRKLKNRKNGKIEMDEDGLST